MHTHFCFQTTTVMNARLHHMTFNACHPAAGAAPRCFTWHAVDLKPLYVCCSRSAPTSTPKQGISAMIPHTCNNVTTRHTSDVILSVFFI
jgi:hypothetical protein